MALREIITVGDPRLRKHSHPVRKVTPEVRTLIQDMIETVDTANGVGLAAVQVGEMVRAIIVEIPEEEDDPNSGKLFVVLNPEVVKEGRETEVGVEGCLSIPGYAGEVERATEIVVRGLDRFGKSFRLRPRGFLARVFQHEIDHCNGVLYTDRLVAPDRIWEVTAGEEEQAEVEYARQQRAKTASV
ncbi:MAG: peptide deformylase [Anaerolineae bacterium]|nr:peptide deformylase [Anaerolineae bacterium]